MTIQLSNTFAFIPAYRASRISNSLEIGRGACKNSESFDVCELADAKYKIVKCPLGGCEGAAIADNKVPKLKKNELATCRTRYKSEDSLI